MRWTFLPLLIASLLLAACTSAGSGRKANSPDRVDQVAILQAKIDELAAQAEQYRKEIQDDTEQIKRFQQQVEDQERNRRTLAELYRRALRSPGYEATIRIVYSHLQTGDAALLRYLLPPGADIEAGIQGGDKDTYRPYQSASDLDLQPFIDWARRHPVESGTFSVVATMPGYAWAVVAFPDGTHFRLLFEEWRVIKILASDRPMVMT